MKRKSRKYLQITSAHFNLSSLKPPLASSFLGVCFSKWFLSIPYLRSQPWVTNHPSLPRTSPLLAVEPLNPPVLGENQNNGLIQTWISLPCKPKPCSKLSRKFVFLSFCCFPYTYRFQSKENLIIKKKITAWGYHPYPHFINSSPSPCFQVLNMIFLNPNCKKKKAYKGNSSIIKIRIQTNVFMWI